MIALEMESELGVEMAVPSTRRFRTARGERGKRLGAATQIGVNKFLCFYRNLLAAAAGSYGGTCFRPVLPPNRPRHILLQKDVGYS
jgi:hypothetical protein